jgi:peptide/nickel transport system substrate-binding protein
MKKLLAVLLVLFVSAAVFAGGGGEAPSASTQETAEAVAPGLTVINRSNGWEIGQKGGEIVIGQLGTGPKSFNAVLAEETSSTDITGMLGAALVQRNQFTLEWEPNMAESWEISADQKTITYTLPSNFAGPTVMI